MPDYIEIILRTFGAFFMLLITTRILGKQALAQMTYFDFVVTITMGGNRSEFSV
ncbi:hypothetical protein GCM10020331_087490 [Ectobacillus funiculus]